MKDKNTELKQLALKVYFLNSKQRRYISADMNALPAALQKYIDELDVKFPSLKKLTLTQRQYIFSEVMQSADKNEWEGLREKIDLMRQDNLAYPSKLYAVLFE